MPFRRVVHACLAASITTSMCGCTPLQDANTSAMTPAPPKPSCPHIPHIPPSKPPPPPLAAVPQILLPGHWDWDNGGYTWTPPQWQARLPEREPKWRNGYWEASGGACVWHNGKMTVIETPARAVK